jgi:hypothetical protein
MFQHVKTLWGEQDSLSVRQAGNLTKAKAGGVIPF